MFEEQFLLFLKEMRLEGKEHYTLNELFRAFNAGGTASLAFLGKVANELNTMATSNALGPNKF